MNEAEDASDIFDTSLSTLFAIPPIAISTSSPDELYTYNPPPGSRFRESVRLRFPDPPPSLYNTLQANHLWLSGIYLADLVCLDQIDVRGTRLAELGAGAGLPGIVACRQRATVVSSDWGATEILDVIRDNFRRACKDGKWEVVGHQWGTDAFPSLNALDSTGKFDILILADTLWATAAHSALLDSIFALLRPGGTGHVAAGLHTGRGPIERFIASAISRGAAITRIREVRWRSDGGWDEYHASTKTLEEERGVVVYFTLQITYPIN